MSDGSAGGERPAHTRGVPLLRFRRPLAAHDLPGGGAGRWPGEGARRRVRLVGVLAVAFAGCGDEGKSRGGKEVLLPGIVQVTPWLEKSGCSQSPYGRSFPTYFDTDPWDGPYLATVEATLDEPVAVGLPSGALVFRLRGGWPDDVPPPYPGCEFDCACEGAASFPLDPGEVLELSVAVTCGRAGTCPD